MNHSLLVGCSMLSLDWSYWIAIGRWWVVNLLGGVFLNWEYFFCFQLFHAVSHLLYIQCNIFLIIENISNTLYLYNFVIYIKQISIYLHFNKLSDRNKYSNMNEILNILSTIWKTYLSFTLVYCSLLGMIWNIWSKLNDSLLQPVTFSVCPESGSV